MYWKSGRTLGMWRLNFSASVRGETAVSGEHVYRRVGDFDCLSYHWRFKKDSAPQSWVTFKFSRKIRPSVVRSLFKRVFFSVIYTATCSSYDTRSRQDLQLFWIARNALSLQTALDTNEQQNRNTNISLNTTDVYFELWSQNVVRLLKRRLPTFGTVNSFTYSCSSVTALLIVSRQL